MAPKADQDTGEYHDYLIKVKVGTIVISSNQTKVSQKKTRQDKTLVKNTMSIS